MSTNLIIAVARQLGAEVMEDTKTHEYRMEIRSSSSSRKYVVSRRKGEYARWECSCMGWIRHRHCKHLEAMVPSLDRALAPTHPRVMPKVEQARPQPRPQPQPESRPEPVRPTTCSEPTWTVDAAAQAMWTEASGNPVVMMAVFRRHLQVAYEAGRRSK